MTLYTYNIAVLIIDGQLDSGDLSWKQYAGSDTSNTSTYHCDLQSLAMCLNDVVSCESLPSIGEFRQWVSPGS